MGTEEAQMRFGKCVVEREIGRGARSTVYLAWHEGLQIPVAVKAMKKEGAGEDDLFSERFMREARIAAQLAHANIVRVYDCGETADSYYLVLEYIDGETCRDRMESEEGVSWREAASIIRQVAEGLSHAGTKGIIHRDLKPENIMIDKDGNVRIADLGLAKEVSPGRASATADGDVLGTPYYMSPEQVRQPGDVDFRADIYSLGATFYHMATGQVPFEAPTPFEIMTMHLNEPLTPPQARNPDLPEELCDIISRAMAKEPQSRYQGYGDLIRDLDAVLQAAADPTDVSSNVNVMDAVEETLDEVMAEGNVQEAGAPGPPAVRLERVRRMRPVELPVTRRDVHAKALGLGAALAYVFLIVCLHQVMAAWAGAVPASAAAVLAVAASVWAARRVLSAPDGAEDTEALAEMDPGFGAALTWTCERLDLPTPRVRFTCRHDERGPAFSLFGAKSTLYVPLPWLEAAGLDESRMRAFMAQKMAGVYNGDAGIRTLLALPLMLIGACEGPLTGLLRTGRLSARTRLRLSRALAMVGLVVFCAAAAVLLAFLPWVGALALMFVCLLLLVSSFERRAQISADTFAMRVLGSSGPVRSLVITSGLLSPERDRLLRESMGDDVAERLCAGLPAKGERARIFEAVAACYAMEPYSPDALDLARAALCSVPPTVERLNRLAKLPGGRSRLVGAVLFARRLLALALGRPQPQPMNTAELRRVRSYWAAGTFAGALEVVVLTFLAIGLSARYEHFMLITGLFGVVLGLLATREACRRGGVAGLVGWAATCTSMAFAVSLALGLCAIGRVELSMQFPVLLVVGLFLASLGAVAYLRIAPLCGIDTHAPDYGEGSKTAHTMMVAAEPESVLQPAPAEERKMVAAGSGAHVRDETAVA